MCDNIKRRVSYLDDIFLHILKRNIKSSQIHASIVFPLLRMSFFIFGVNLSFFPVEQSQLFTEQIWFICGRCKFVQLHHCHCAWASLHSLSLSHQCSQFFSNYNNDNHIDTLVFWWIALPQMQDKKNQHAFWKCPAKVITFKKKF